MLLLSVLLHMLVVEDCELQKSHLLVTNTFQLLLFDRYKDKLMRVLRDTWLVQGIVEIG